MRAVEQTSLTAGQNRITELLRFASDSQSLLLILNHLIIEHKNLQPQQEKYACIHPPGQHINLKQHTVFTPFVSPGNLGNRQPLAEEQQESPATPRTQVSARSRNWHLRVSEMRNKLSPKAVSIHNKNYYLFIAIYQLVIFLPASLTYRPSTVFVCIVSLTSTPYPVVTVYALRVICRQTQTNKTYSLNMQTTLWIKLILIGHNHRSF